MLFLTFFFFFMNLKDLVPRMLHIQFVFNQLSSFREDILLYGHGSHLVY